MKDIKKQFTEDFELSSKKVDLSFDVTQLESNTKQTRHRFKHWPLVISLGCVATAIVGIAVPVMSNLLKIQNKSVNKYTKTYTIEEIQLADKNTPGTVIREPGSRSEFEKLNEVVLPNLQNPKANALDENEMNAYNSFANKTYHAIVDTSNSENMSCNAIGLYSILNNLYGASSSRLINSLLDGLLGLSETTRKIFYDKVVFANFYARENNTTQLRNSAFFNNEFTVNNDYIRKLTDFYCESYQISFKTRSKEMVNWVNQALHSEGFIDQQFLGLDLEGQSRTQLVLFSTLFFKNAWQNKYLTTNNVKGDFYLNDGTTKEVTYMTHSYHAPYYYDYGSYISVKDYYDNGDNSITFIIPKDHNDNIYELTEYVNIFEEKEENKVLGINDDPIMIKMKTPKIKFKTDMEYNNALKSLGFEDMFNSEIDTLSNAFSGNHSGTNFHMKVIKERNEVEFNEDGTTVKSVVMGTMNGTESVQREESLDVNLDQPFIYIIRDINQTPIFVGHVDNPKY